MQVNKKLDPLDEFAPAPVESTPRQLNPLDEFAPAPLQNQPNPLEEFAPAPAAPQEQGLLGKYITKEDIAAIAAKRGVDEQALSDLVPFYGGLRQEVSGKDSKAGFLDQASEAANYLTGAISRGVLFGAPQAALKSEVTPEYKAALEDLQQVIEKKKSLAATVGDVALNLKSALQFSGAASAVTKGLGVTGKAATAADVGYNALSAVGGGAAEGYFNARPGEELESAARSAAIGAGLLAGVSGLKALIPAAKKAPAALDDAIKKLETNVDAVDPAVQKEITEETKALIYDVAEKEASDILEPARVTKLLSLQEIPADSAELTKVLFSAEEIAERGTKIELRLVRDNPEALGVLSERTGPFANKAFRDLTLVTQDLQQELKALGRITLGDNETRLKTTQELVQLLQKEATTEGVEFLAQQARKSAVLTRAGQLMNEGTILPLNALEREANKGDFVVNLAETMADARYVARAIDDRLGTGLEVTMDKFAQQNNFKTQHLAALAPEMRTVFKKTAESGIDNDALYNAVNKGTLEGITAEQAPVVQAWKNFYKGMLKTANDLGLPIKELENYLPHMTVGYRESVRRITNAVATIEKETGINLQKTAVSKEVFESLKNNTTVNQLSDALGYLSGEKISTGQELQEAVLKSLNSNTSQTFLKTKASAAFERIVDEVPELIREKDMQTLARRYVTNTLNHAYIREPLAEMRLARDVAADFGDKRAATYLQNLVTDITGGRREGTLAAITDKYRLQVELIADKMVQESKDPLVQAGGKGILFLSDTLPSIVAQVYPNFLGLNLRAVLQNLTQPLLMTAPELGGAEGLSRAFSGYGVSRAISGLANVVDEITNGVKIVVKNRDQARALSLELGRPVALGETVTTRKMEAILESKGLLGRNWNTDLQDFLQDSVSSGVVGTATKDTLQKWNTAAMFLYERAERANRMWTASIAKDVAQDLIEKNPNALSFMSKMGSGYRRQIEKTLAAGDAEATQKLVTDYLVGKTLFNYTRASLSQFGRSAGTVFSVFTKWPTSIGADIIQTLQRQGAIEGGMDVFNKYVTPLAALYAADKLIFPEGQNDVNRQVFVGKKGLTSWAPAGSIGSIASGDLLQPPVVSTIASGLSAIATADEKGMMKWFNDSLRAFVPGAALVRFMSSDLRALQGKAPVQGSFVQQVEQIPEAF